MLIRAARKGRARARPARAGLALARLKGHHAWAASPQTLAPLR